MTPANDSLKKLANARLPDQTRNMHRVGHIMHGSQDTINVMTNDCVSQQRPLYFQSAQSINQSNMDDATSFSQFKNGVGEEEGYDLE